MPDLIFFNANVITLDPGLKKAQLVAVRDGRIIAVTGVNSLGQLRRRHTRMVDCNAKTLLPGFIDAHCHLRATAAREVSVDLSPRENVLSINDIKSKIKKHSQRLKPGTWVRATGYDEFYLSEKRHPTRWDLDEAAADHPVKLVHRSGHAHVLNSLALKLVGITKSTPDPPGGLMDRAPETGEPTGILYEMNAVLSKRIPPRDESELNRGLMLLNQKWLSQGITSIHDASVQNDLAQWSSFCSLKQREIILPRITMMIGSKSIAKFTKSDFSCPGTHGQLRLGAVKIIIDETTGRLYPPQKELNAMVLEHHRNGRQVAIHAIEENAVESACDAIEFALNNFPRTDHRHRIEHCSVCPRSLSQRIASLGIMVVTQPDFVFHNGDRYRKTVPERQLQNIYPIGSLMKNNVLVAGSSDSPIAPPSPMGGISSAVNRLTDKGNLILPQERISVLQALQLYTTHAARAGFEDEFKGTIAPGKLADMVLISGDPMTVPSEKLKDLAVEMTIIDGKVVWSRSG